MKRAGLSLAKSIWIASVMLLVCDAAFALRCGNRLVKDGMPEAQVIELCGEPVSIRPVGHVLRPYIVKVPAGISVSHGMKHIYGGYHYNLEVTEMLFNFGPHKLMRLIRFEGGRVADIRTVGYGYREKTGD